MNIENDEVFVCTCEVCKKQFTTDNPMQELCFLCLNEYSDWLVSNINKKLKNKEFYSYLTE